MTYLDAAVKDRSKIFKAHGRSESATLPIFSNGKNDWSTGVSLSLNDEARSLGVRIGVPVRLAIEYADALVGRVGPLASAWWGGADLPELARVTSEQYKSSLPDAGDVEPPFGLPWLKTSFELGDPVRPPYLFWLNYWSDEAALMVGFEESVAQTVFSQVQRIDGGWLLRLTDDPFDSGRDDHVRRLVAGYQHFEGVGRIPPKGRRA